MTGLCLSAAGLTKFIPVLAFTLAWTHSVEKVAWQEDWVVEDTTIRLVAARVKGSGAGMEPGPRAHRVGAFWEWHPEGPRLPRLLLGNSGAAGSWHLCVAEHCKTAREWLGTTQVLDGATLASCVQD